MVDIGLDFRENLCKMDACRNLNGFLLVVTGFSVMQRARIYLLGNSNTDIALVSSHAIMCVNT